MSTLRLSDNEYRTLCKAILRRDGGSAGTADSVVIFTCTTFIFVRNKAQMIRGI